MNFNPRKGGLSKTTSSIDLRGVLDDPAAEEGIQIVDIDSGSPRLRPAYDSVAAYNKEAPGRELPHDTDDIKHVFHNAIEDGGIEFCLDFAPLGLDADPDKVGNLVLRPWNGDGPIIVLAVGITRAQVNELIVLSRRPHTLKRLRAELENLGFPAPQ